MGCDKKGSQSLILYVFLCFVYIISLLGNIFIMFVICTDHSLHNPKYIAVFNLAVADLCGSTALVPKLINTFLFESQYFSYEECLANMFFVFFFITSQSLTLAVLSYDRYVAICHPLRYHELVTNTSMSVIIAAVWSLSALFVLIAVGAVTRLSFCNSVVVNSYFCDHGPVIRLACNDNAPNRAISLMNPIVILWVPVSFITATYVCIAYTLSRIASATERLKAMKTCTSHLVLVGTFYLPVCMTYVIGSTIHPNARIINLSLTMILPPMLNPLIYSLKTEEFLESIKKLFRRHKIMTARRNT
ncbi:olfactory receptor 51E2-like [Megalops cyprinoides]|uniref:olfactory receptor 51E2-like n=1 Tax=Megalops cyprinoides TaxID=118141 RepID=UPI001864A8EC|nr:olfactory receptor 51E2-like [Megalops cyprinoides]